LHASLTAQDAAALSAFYKAVFGCVDRRAPRFLSGADVARGNGLPDARLLSIWLDFPDSDGAFLEILEYEETPKPKWPAVNAPGFSHLAIRVEDLDETLSRLARAGGTMQGAIVDFGTATSPHRIVYVRDPEGNVLELEQY